MEDPEHPNHVTFWTGTFGFYGTTSQKSGEIKTRLYFEINVFFSRVSISLPFFLFFIM